MTNLWNVFFFIFDFKVWFNWKDYDVKFLNPMIRLTVKCLQMTALRESWRGSVMGGGLSTGGSNIEGLYTGNIEGLYTGNIEGLYTGNGDKGRLWKIQHIFSYSDGSSNST